MFVNDCPGRRFVAVVTAVVFLSATLGCHSWNVVPLTPADLEAEQLPSRDARVTMKSGEVIQLRVTSLEFPVVSGWMSQPGGTRLHVDVDLHEVAQFEVHELDAGLTVLLVVVVVVAVLLVVVAIAASSSGFFIPGR